MDAHHGVPVVLRPATEHAVAQHAGVIDQHLHVAGRRPPWRRRCPLRAGSGGINKQTAPPAEGTSAATLLGGVAPMSLTTTSALFTRRPAHKRGLLPPALVMRTVRPSQIPVMALSFASVGEGHGAGRAGHAASGTLELRSQQEQRARRRRPRRTGTADVGRPAAVPVQRGTDIAGWLADVEHRREGRGRHGRFHIVVVGLVERQRTPASGGGAATVGDSRMSPGEEEVARAA